MKRSHSRSAYYSLLIVCTLIFVFIIIISIVNRSHQFQFNKILNNINFLLQIFAYSVAAIGIVKYVDVLSLMSKNKEQEHELKFSRDQNKLIKRRSKESKILSNQFFTTISPIIRSINEQYKDIKNSTKQNIRHTSKIKVISTDMFWQQMSKMQGLIGDISKALNTDIVNEKELRYSIGIPFLNFMN